MKFKYTTPFFPLLMRVGKNEWCPHKFRVCFEIGDGRAADGRIADGRVHGRTAGLTGGAGGREMDADGRAPDDE